MCYQNGKMKGKLLDENPTLLQDKIMDLYQYLQGYD